MVWQSSQLITTLWSEDQRAINATHRERLPGLLYSELATRPNSIGTWVGVTDVISHAKCGNDHLNEYNITDGQILPCFTGMAYCL